MWYPFHTCAIVGLKRRTIFYGPLSSRIRLYRRQASQLSSVLTFLVIDLYESISERLARPHRFAILPQYASHLLSRNRIVHCPCNIYRGCVLHGRPVGRLTGHIAYESCVSCQRLRHAQHGRHCCSRLMIYVNAVATNVLHLRFALLAFCFARVLVALSFKTPGKRCHALWYQPQLFYAFSSHAMRLLPPPFSSFQNSLIGAQLIPLEIDMFQLFVRMSAVVKSRMPYNREIKC